MKKTITLFAMATLSLGSCAQTLVSTTPSNRNAIIEEFTGTSCPGCPNGHTVLTGILNANPGTVFGIGYSPTNSSLTGPYAGGLDLTNPFSDSFYTNPYYGNGDGRAMPTGHINRTKYNGSRKSSTSDWASRAADINALASSVNVGLASTYNSGTDMVDVTVEMYFTADVTDAAYVTVIMTEDDIITTQAGTAGNYSHKHVMRADLQNGQWGEALTGTTTAGSLVTMTFSFDNSGTNYVIDNCDIIAFVSTGTDDNSEILTGSAVSANGGSTAGITQLSANNEIKVFPNPTNGEINIALSANATSGSVSILNLAGRSVYVNDLNSDAGSILTLQKSDLNLEAGTYFVSFSNESINAIKKLIVQ